MTFSWALVTGILREKAESASPWHGVVATDGQKAAMAAMADRIDVKQRALLIADEVGMGKTLIAATLADAVVKAGGRVAVVMPPGIGTQWRNEFSRVDPDFSPLLPLRSIWTLFDAFRDPEQEETDRRAENRKKEYNARRQLKELPVAGKSWADESVLLLSHNLARFQWTNTQSEYARTLLDQMRNALENRRRYIKTNKQLFARELADHLCSGSQLDVESLRSQLKSSDNIQDKFHILLGRMLGKFDLVILDEAHKARGLNSSISRMLGRILWKRRHCFHLGMTATPIELDNGQWISTLKRINVPKEALESIEIAVDQYDKAIERLRSGPLSIKAVENFAEPARRMEAALKPWVIRRDLRDDPWMQKFIRAARAKGVGDHRERKQLPILFGQMDLGWKRAFMASEALALKAGGEVAPADRRRRLAIAAGIDHNKSMIDADPAALEETFPNAGESVKPWLNLARIHVRTDELSHLRHPLLTAAVDLIENKTNAGEKVLVFGRFNDPLSALTHLLDMREMVRRLTDPDTFDWPQTRLGDPQRSAFAVAFESRAATCPIEKADFIDIFLREKYEARRVVRAEARSLLVDLLSSRGIESSENRVTRAWRAIETQVGGRIRNGVHLHAATKTEFENLISRCYGDDEEDQSSRRTPDVVIDAFLDGMEGRQGHFANFLNGETSPQTRRNLQYAFNEPDIWPKVLVAQSRVASEGLNLQPASRCVLMLHPEWNPAICEQQIGRVDRLDSLWRRMAEEYLSAGGANDPPPRIEVLMPYIEGTYAEHNLRVLKTRWDRLRAQLHGDILALDEALLTDIDMFSRAKKIQKLTPRFHP